MSEARLSNARHSDARHSDARLSNAWHSDAWLRLVTALGLGFALLVLPAGATGRITDRPANRGVTQAVPGAADTVAAVLRSAPAVGSAATKHATGGVAIGILASVGATVLGWTVLRGHRRATLARRFSRTAAARAPPSTVGF